MKKRWRYRTVLNSRCLLSKAPDATSRLSRGPVCPTLICFSSLITVRYIFIFIFPMNYLHMKNYSHSDQYLLYIGEMKILCRR